MKLSTMPMLLLLLGLVGTWARKPGSQQELSAAPDAGFGANSLAGIETSLLSLAREKSTPDSSTSESIAIILSYIAAMKDDVLTRASATQSGLNQSWNNLVNCRLNLTDASTNLTILNATHRDCSQEESTMGAQHLSCLSTCETQCTSSQAVCDQYCAVNVPDMPSPSPSPSPGTCHFSGPVKGDDEIGDYKEWDSNVWYERWVGYFDGLYSDWSTKRTNCMNTATTMQNCYQHCTSTYGTSYETKKQECTDHQYDLEAAACHETSSNCLAYQSCHGALYNTYQADVNSANSSQSSWYSEYMGIMRVECLLSAYNSSLAATTGYTEGEIQNAEYSAAWSDSSTYWDAADEASVQAACDADSDCLGYWQGWGGDKWTLLKSGSRTWSVGVPNDTVLVVKVKGSGSDLASAMDSCQTTTFYPCTEQPSLCLQIYPYPEEEACNGTYGNTTLQPGSAAWIEAFYTDMPNMTTWETCGAQCCDSGGPTPPTPTSFPATNCSLCTNESF